MQAGHSTSKEGKRSGAAAREGLPKEVGTEIVRMGGEEGGWGWDWAPWQEAKSGARGGTLHLPNCVYVWVSLQLLSLFAVVVCSSFSSCCCCMWRLSVEVVVCCCHSWLSVVCVPPPLPSPQLFACLLPHIASTCVALIFYLALPLLISRCHAFYLHASVHIFTTPFFCFGCGRGEKQGEMGGEGGVAGGRVVERRWRVREGLWEGGGG